MKVDEAVFERRPACWGPLGYREVMSSRGIRGSCGLLSPTEEGDIGGGDRLGLRRTCLRVNLDTAVADWTFRSGLLPEDFTASRLRWLVKKLVEYGVGLLAPSLALMGILRELDRVGTGNGGATAVTSWVVAEDALGLPVRCAWAAVPLEMRAFRRMSSDFVAMKGTAGFLLGLFDDLAAGEAVLSA